MKMFHENNVPTPESDEVAAEKAMEKIIEYADKHKFTAQEIEKAFSMVMTDDSSEEDLRPEVLELGNLLVDIKTNQFLNDSVRSYIQVAYLTENLGTTFN